MNMLELLREQSCTDEEALREKIELKAKRDEIKKAVIERMSHYSRIVGWIFGGSLKEDEDGHYRAFEFVKDDNTHLRKGMCTLLKRQLNDGYMPLQEYCEIDFSDLCKKWYFILEEKDADSIVMIHNFESVSEAIGLWMA